MENYEIGHFCQKHVFVVVFDSHYALWLQIRLWPTIGPELRVFERLESAARLYFGNQACRPDNRRAAEMAWYLLWNGEAHGR